MIRYKIEEICGDWAIYEVWETETEGGKRCLLILDSRANAEYIKAILEHEARYPNAAERYFPRAELMSDAEVLAVGRLCCAGGNRCSGCPVLVVGDEGAKCFEIERRVLEMAEKWLELKKEPAVGGEDEKKTIKAMKYDICESADYCYGACCECNFESLAKALYARDWRKQSEGEWVKQKPDPEAMKVFHEKGLGKGMSVNSIYWTCSVCDNWGTPQHKYCSSCGARMKGGAE